MNHVYLHQLSDSRDDYTLDCGVWRKLVHFGKKCTEYHTNLIDLLVLNLKSKQNAGKKTEKFDYM